jgi:hypothetical protein
MISMSGIPRCASKILKFFDFMHRSLLLTHCFKNMRGFLFGRAILCTGVRDDCLFANKIKRYTETGSPSQHSAPTHRSDALSVGRDTSILQMFC